MIDNLTNEQRKILSGKMINIQVNIYEAAVLQKIRAYTHGKFIVHMLDGVPIRCETLGSEVIEQSSEFEILLSTVLKGEKL